MGLQSKLYASFDEDPMPIVQFIGWLVDRSGLRGKLDVLDVGCGPGWMLPAYAAKGWRVVGMEPDLDYYQEAKKAVAGLTAVRIRAGGFDAIEDDEAYDLITAVNGPFAYLLTPPEQMDALNRLFHALRPGGVLFLDLPNLLWFLKHEPDEQFEGVEEIDGREVYFRTRYEWDFHDALFTQVNEYLIGPGEEGERRIDVHNHAIISRPALSQLVSRAGFVEQQTYNTYESRQNERLHGSRLMLSAQKPR